MARVQAIKSVPIVAVMGVSGCVRSLEDLSDNQIVYLIDRWVLGVHAERNRAIAKRRLIDGICYEPLSEEFQLSPRRTWDIVESVKQKMLKHIDSINQM